MRRGIMVFDVPRQNWKIWIGQQEHETFRGMRIEIRIKNRYHEACLEKAFDEWIVTFEDDVTFTLWTVEVYKVRISRDELVSGFDLPF